MRPRTSTRICVLAGLACVALDGPAGRAQVPEASRFIPSVPEIRSLLQSGELRDQAWGAWLAAQAKAPALVPEIQRVAERHRAAKTWPAPAVLGAALDALIQIGQPVPAAWARTFYAQRPAEALILITRATDAHDVLVDLTRTENGLPWYAAANVLVAQRSPRVAVHLLRGLVIEGTAAIVRDARQSVGTAGGVAGAIVGDGAGGLLPGFPPLAHTYLSSGAHPGGVVLAAGPTSVYFCRSVSQPGQTPPGTSHDLLGPTPTDRLRYVAELLGEPQLSLPLAASESRTIVWRDRAALDAAVAAFRADLESRYRRLIDSLIERNLLSRAEASTILPARIAITLRDLR